MILASGFVVLLLATGPQSESVRELIEKLDSDGLEDRQKAADELVKRGDSALPELRRASQPNSPEHLLLVRRLIRRIVLGPEASAKFTKLNLGLDESMAWELDHTWTEFFIEVTGSPGGQKLHPELTGADLSPFLATAVRGSESYGERIQIFSEASERKIPGAVPLLSVLLADPDPDARAMGLRYLTLLSGPDRSIPALGLLEDPSDRVRRDAFGTLEDLHARSAVPKLIQLLAHADASIRDRAVHALGRLRSRKAVPGVRALLKDRSPAVRARAAEALGLLQALDAESGLETLLGDTDPDVRLAAAFALAQLESDKAVPELTKVASAAQPGPGSQALWALESLAPEVAEQIYLRLLQDPSAPLRESAVCFFQRHPSKEAVPALLSLVRHFTLGDQAVRALSFIRAPEAVPAVIELLSKPGLEEEAARALREFAAPEAAPALIRCLSAPNDSLRQEAAWALVAIPSRDKVPALRAALREGNAETAALAAQVLSESGAKEAIPDLITRLGDRSSTHTVRYATALAKLGSPRGTKTLRELLVHSPAATYRTSAAWALDELAAREAIPELVQALQDGDHEVRFGALNALRDLRAVPEAAKLLPLLTDEDPAVSWTAFEILIDWGQKEKGPQIRKLLHGTDPAVRSLAADALGRLGQRDALPDLVELLDDADPVVLSRALDALGDLGVPEAAPGARRLLGTGDERVRLSAALTLAKIGAKEAAPDLVKLLDDASSNVARAALQALVWMDREEAIEPLLRLAAQGDDSLLAWLGRRDPEGVGRPCGGVPGSDFFLNAYRTPTVWNRLRPVWYVREPGDTVRQALERIAGASGLPLSWPDTPTTQWPHHALDKTQWQQSPGAAGVPRSNWIPDQAEARSPLLRALQATAADGGYQVILENDRIRLVPQAEADALWRTWWREERRKSAEK